MLLKNARADRLLMWLIPLLMSFALVVLLGSLVAECDSMDPLSEGESTTVPPPEPEAQSFPRWSPDGNRILYYDHGLEYDSQTGQVGQNPDVRGLWTIRPDWTDRQQVLAGVSLYGDWSPNGDSLIF